MSGIRRGLMAAQQGGGIHNLVFDGTNYFDTGINLNEYDFSTVLLSLTSHSNNDNALGQWRAIFSFGPDRDEGFGIYQPYSAYNSSLGNGIYIYSGSRQFEVVSDIYNTRCSLAVQLFTDASGVRFSGYRCMKGGAIYSSSFYGASVPYLDSTLILGACRTKTTGTPIGLYWKGVIHNMDFFDKEMSNAEIDEWFKSIE